MLAGTAGRSVIEATLLRSGRIVNCMPVKPRSGSQFGIALRRSRAIERVDVQLRFVGKFRHTTESFGHAPQAIRECLNHQRPFDRRDGQAKVSTILGLPSTLRGAPRSEKKSSVSL